MAETETNEDEEASEVCDGDRSQGLLGKMITKEIWADALELVEQQIGFRKDYWHFRTPSMYAYSLLPESDRRALRDPDYYHSYIASGLFYALEDVFRVIRYPVPKGRAGLGRRRAAFMSYPMRAVYYAMGLYIGKLANEFREEYVRTPKRRERIEQFYGADLPFGAPTMKFSHRRLYYKHHYQAFKKCVLKWDVEDSDVIVVHLDVQDFYDCISIPRLAEALGRCVKPGIARRMGFDRLAQEEIILFYRFAAGGIGILQSDNDVVSSYIGGLYLTPADLWMDSELSGCGDTISEHQVVRYVDDTYIVLRFRDDVDEKARTVFTSTFASRAADYMLRELGLRLNAKSRTFRMECDADRKEFRASVKRTSGSHTASDDCSDKGDGETDAATQIAQIIAHVGKLRGAAAFSVFDKALWETESSMNQDVLKGIYDESVQQLMQAPDVKKRLRDALMPLDPAVAKVSPREMAILYINDPDTGQKLRAHIAEGGSTLEDVGLMLAYLGQMQFHDEELLDVLAELPDIGDAIKCFSHQELGAGLTGYHGLHISDVRRLVGSDTYIIEQARRRVMAEREERYSVALNHLVNEVQSICRLADGSSKPGQKYDANAVCEFLLSQALPHRLVIAVRNMFDRRNSNQVSHGGSDEQQAWGVTNAEYTTYKERVGECLTALIAIVEKDTD